MAFVINFKSLKRNEEAYNLHFFQAVMSHRLIFYVEEKSELLK